MENNISLLPIPKSIEIPLDLRVEVGLALLNMRELINMNNYVKCNDPCICGSGRKFKVCHMDLFVKYFNVRIKQ